METKGGEVSERCRINLLGLRKEKRPKVYTLPFLGSKKDWKKEMLKQNFCRHRLRERWRMKYMDVISMDRKGKL